MEFYTKLGIAAITIIVIVLIVLWTGYFSSPELSYVIAPETASTSNAAPFATAGSNIITMKSDGDFELVPVVNVNNPINEARTQRNQIRADAATKLNNLANNAQGDAQSLVNTARDALQATLGQHEGWINANESRSQANIDQGDADARYVKLGNIPGGQYNIKLHGNHSNADPNNPAQDAYTGGVGGQYLYADRTSEIMKRSGGRTGNFSGAQFTFH